jgi:hypothetical protein
VSTAPRPGAPAGEGPPDKITKYLMYLEWFNWCLGWLYVPGLFFVLLFVFLPKIDEARIRRMELSYNDNNAPWKKKAIELEEKRNKKREESFNKKERDFKTDKAEYDEKRRELYSRNPNDDTKATDEAKTKWNEEKKALDLEEIKIKDKEKVLRNEEGGLNFQLDKAVRADLEKLDKDKLEWKTKKQFLELDKQEVENAAKTRAIWYYLGQIFATIVLMLGAIGYLSPKESQLRRAVGVVTIGAVILLVAAQLNGGKSVLFGPVLLLAPRAWQTAPLLPNNRRKNTTTSG